jgi:hypothetical protein
MSTQNVLVCDCLVGHIGLQATTTEISSFIVAFAIGARMWCMHDGAPARFSRALRDVLSNTHHDRWVGRGGTTAWPPRSPDLNPLDFYLWGHIKTLVYAAPVDNEEALHHRMPVRLRNYPGIFERMRRSMMRRVEACAESHGGHFVHLSEMYYFSWN